MAEIEEQKTYATAAGVTEKDYEQKWALVIFNSRYLQSYSKSLPSIIGTCAKEEASPT